MPSLSLRSGLESSIGIERMGTVTIAVRVALIAGLNCHVAVGVTAAVAVGVAGRVHSDLLGWASIAKATSSRLVGLQRAVGWRQV